MLIIDLQSGHSNTCLGWAQYVLASYAAIMAKSPRQIPHTWAFDCPINGPHSNLRCWTLRRHALRYGLQRSGRRGIFKKHEKTGIKQVLERTDGVLGFFKTKFYFEQKNVELKLVNGQTEKLFGKSVS
jgi:hypothetical protein